MLILRAHRIMKIVLILAMDTTSEWGGAGIFRDAECVMAIRHESPANYSVALFQMVEKMLEQARLELREIDLFAAANGPGSFTGIRVGLAAVQGWARAFEKPLRPVSVLEALVEEARPETDHAFPLLDARRGEFYAGLFQRALANGQDSPAAGGEWALVNEAVALKPGSLAPYLQTHAPGGATLTSIVRESDAAAGALRSLLPESIRWRKVSDFLVPAIAQLASRAHTERKPFSIHDVSAYYIRRSEAELNWKD